MMQSFTQHYYLQEKITSDIRRAFTSNLLKKRKVGIDLGKGKYKKISEVSSNIFKDTLNELQSGARAYFTGQKEKKAFFGKKGYGSGLTSTLRKLSGTEIKGVYEGEIDSGSERIKGNVESSLVFEVQNGAKIAFITTQDGDEMRYYISTNTRGNDFFRENLGTTLEQLGAESRSKITKDKFSNKEEPEDEELPIEEPEEKNEYGIMDISLDDMNTLEELWGDGKKGLNNKQYTYEFKNKFKKQRFDYKGYEGIKYYGYKYFNNQGDAIYLMNTGDKRNAFILFKDRHSKDWASRIGMLSFWKSQPGKTKIEWKKGKVEGD